MKFILKKYLLTVLSVFILTQVIPAFSISGSWSEVFFASFILSLLLYIVRPILNLIMLPLNLVTLNLTSWIGYIIIFYFWTLLVSQVKIFGWQFSGIHIGPITLSSFNLVKWQVTVISGLLLVIINKILNWIFK